MELHALITAFVLLVSASLFLCSPLTILPRQRGRWTNPSDIEDADSYAIVSDYFRNQHPLSDQNPDISNNNEPVDNSGLDRTLDRNVQFNIDTGRISVLPKHLLTKRNPMLLANRLFYHMFIIKARHRRIHFA